MGMLIYFSANSRPEIAFYVHQCALFIHDTKACQEEYLKRICQYLQGTRAEGMIFTPKREMVINFYDGAYFMGLNGYYDPKYPICVKRSKIYFITFSDYALLCVSKLQN